MSTQNDWIVQQDFAHLKGRLLALSYGRHVDVRTSAELENLPESAWGDYEGRHRLQQIHDVGQLKGVVFYNAGRKGFQRGLDMGIIT